MDNKKREVLAKIRTAEKTTLQWIQNALIEAQNDSAEVGRPLTMSHHDGEYKSMLTDALNQDSKPIQMTGLVNLLIMLLVITNIKNVLVSLNQNGFTLTGELIVLYENNFYVTTPANINCILAIIAMTIFPAISYCIELIATTGCSWVFINLLSVLNITALILYPLVVSFKLEPNYLLGAGLLLICCTTILKLVSYHHTMHDVRHLLERVAKAKKHDKTLTKNPFEGTILGVAEVQYNYACTYPKCMVLSHFIRFLFAPTCCF